MSVEDTNGQIQSLNYEDFDVEVLEERIELGILAPPIHPDKVDCKVQGCGDFGCTSDQCGTQHCASQFCQSEFCTTQNNCESFSCEEDWCSSDCPTLGQGCPPNGVPPQ